MIRDIREYRRDIQVPALEQPWHLVHGRPSLRDNLPASIPQLRLRVSGLETGGQESVLHAAAYWKNTPSVSMNIQAPDQFPLQHLGDIWLEQRFS